MAATLGGFKARELRAAAKREPWYATEWRRTPGSTPGSESFVPSAATTTSSPSSTLESESLLLMMISDRDDAHFGTLTPGGELERALSTASGAVFASPLQRGMLQRRALLIAAAALAFAQATAAASATAWIVSAGAQSVGHADPSYPVSQARTNSRSARKVIAFAQKDVTRKRVALKNLPQSALLPISQRVLAQLAAIRRWA